MKYCLKILLLILSPFLLNAQHNLYWEEWDKNQIDSLQSAWHQVHNDTLKMAIARSLGLYYQERDRDSGLYFSEQQLSLAKKLHQRLWQADASDQLGYILAKMKNYPRSLQSFLDGISISESKESENNIWRISIFSSAKDPRVARLTVLGYLNNDMAVVYRATGNTQDALNHLLLALTIGESIKNYGQLSMTCMALGSSYLDLNKLDSALSYAEDGLQYADQANFLKYRSELLAIMGRIHLKKGNTTVSKKYFEEAMQSAQLQNNPVVYGSVLLDMAQLFIAPGSPDSSLWYARRGLETLTSAHDPEGVIKAYSSLASVYKSRNKLDSAFKYLSLAEQANEQLNNIEKINQFKNVGFNERERLQQLEMEKTKFRNTIRTYVLLSGLGVFILIAFLLYRNNRQKKKANRLLAKQKEEIQNTLSELRSTQLQLIQSEKMASLGELTAGIAHEIQNPLNFVNNFSEVSNELLDEMNGELDKGDTDEAKKIAGNVKENLEKILHHGKRADAIVKGMLQHSRAGTEIKEPTDINALCDEYLRLAYHGLRAKDKTFSAKFESHYDTSIEKINVVAQDMGRVILNLINNAFYATGEKQKQHIPGYEPTVSVSTSRTDSKIEIRIKDNGNGIPQKVMDKIFQPFFTTKPTGAGTGLGLSISYDIVKAQGGEIRVYSREGEFTEFVVQLPIALRSSLSPK
jgi:signal transduction histidine kinase